MRYIIEHGGGSGGVTSVNGKSGIVVLKGNDIKLNDDLDTPIDQALIAMSDELSDKQDVLTAGDNITIVNNVISAEGANYEAGNNIIIQNNVISATDTKYTAGSGVSISSNNVISASIKETDIKSGDVVKDGITPLDFAAYNEFNPNRLAYMDGSQITVEKSTDGGATWSAYEGLTTSDKQSLVTLQKRLYTGGAATGTGTGNRLRVTISTYSNLYMRTKKLLVNVTTNGVSGPKMLIENATIGSPDTFTAVRTVDIGGWPGWNSVPYEFVFGGSTQAAQIRKVRLTFYYGTAASSGNQLILDMIRILGAPIFNAPSTLASTGHMYTYDIDKNVTFPGNVYAANMLPPITAADEGKVLKIVNGVPTWVAP